MGESKRRVVFQHYHLLLSRGAKKEKKDARILLLFYQRAIVICCLPEDIDPIVPTDLIVLIGPAAAVVGGRIILLRHPLGRLRVAHIRHRGVHIPRPSQQESIILGKEKFGTG